MPFESLERVLERAEAAADDTRACWGFSGPLSPFEAARLLKIPVVLNRHLPVRGLTAKGDPIWLRDGDRETRMNSALAHEIGHHIVYDQNSEHLERACDRFAAALLLPRFEFLESVRDLDADPLAIQRAWRFSSVAAVTRRIAEVVPGARSAGWLELRAKWREGEPPRPPTRRELEALSDSYCRPRGVAVVEGQGGVLRVWRTGTGPRSAVSVLMAA